MQDYNNMCGMNYGQDYQQQKKKSKKKGPKVTNQVIEDELEHLAQCFEVKRQQRLAKIPADIADCIKVNRCCKPRPTCVDLFYERFVKELHADDKMRRKIKTQSACRVSKEFQKFAPTPKPPLPCPLPCVCKTVTCPCPQQQQQPQPQQQSRRPPSAAPRPKSPWGGPRKTPSNGHPPRKPGYQGPQAGYQGPQPGPRNAPPRISMPAPRRDSSGSRNLSGDPYGGSSYRSVSNMKYGTPSAPPTGQWGSVKHPINDETCAHVYPCK